jgi:hypothetical protein
MVNNRGGSPGPPDCPTTAPPLTGHPAAAAIDPGRDGARVFKEPGVEQPDLSVGVVGGDREQLLQQQQ